MRGQNAAGQRTVARTGERECSETMKSAILNAIKQVSAERKLSQDVVIQAVEAALISAYKRNYGAANNITATLDPVTGQAVVYAEKEVVEQVSDPKIEMTVREARRIKPDAELGDLIQVESTPRDFGRIAAQTAKQVILQRIREAERDVQYNAFAEREGELVTGTIQNVDLGTNNVTINLEGAEAILPAREQAPGERYRRGNKIRAYVVDVRKSSRGPQITVSRRNPGLLRRLLEVEVPEIFNGSVEIKAIAREAGSRSKVAVHAVQAGVDPVGSCVGVRGNRIQNIVNELSGEKIDVVRWDPDTGTFITNALSPAKAMNVLLDDSFTGSKTATVIVPDRQLSLAIGKEGQNARLAAKLTNWRIDIKSATEAADEALSRLTQPAAGSEADLLMRAEAILRKREAAGLTEEERHTIEAELAAAGERDVLDWDLPPQPEAEAGTEEPEAEALPEAEMELPVAEEAVEEPQVEVMAVAEPVAEAVMEPEPITEAPEVEPEPHVSAQEAEPELEPEEPLAEAELEPWAMTDTEGDRELDEELLDLAEEEEPEAPEIADEDEEEDWDWEEAIDEAPELDEEDEEGRPDQERGRRKKKKHRPGRTLEFDEELGRVVIRRRRKSHRRTDWDETEY
jgi:N utilization substance protein A